MFDGEPEGFNAVTEVEINVREVFFKRKTSEIRINCTQMCRF